MILSAHIVIGAGVGVATNEPIVGVAAALASHYLLDAIPHREYEIPNFRAGSAKAFVGDLCKVALDFAVGFAIVAILTSGNIGALLLGLVGALPDATTFLCILLKRFRTAQEPAWTVRLLFRHLAFHERIQSLGIQGKTPWRIAITTQMMAIGLGSLMLLQFLQQ